jgi:hypothetical protein
MGYGMVLEKSPAVGVCGAVETALRDSGMAKEHAHRRRDTFVELLKKGTPLESVGIRSFCGVAQASLRTP